MSGSSKKTARPKGGSAGMDKVREVKIDAKNRTGALTGLVKPGQRHTVAQVRPGMLVLTRVNMRPVKAWLVRKNGLLLLTNGRRITHEDVTLAQEGFL